MIRLVVVGAAGRMGRVVRRLVAQADDIEPVALIDAPNHPDLGQAAEGEPPLRATWPEALPSPAVVVDFSLPGALKETAAAVQRLQAAWVCGVTGLDDEVPLTLAAARAPVLHAPNLSIGVHLLFGLARWLKARLPIDYDLEVVEAHHRRKIDSPSGTAERLVELLGGDEVARPVHGRLGACGPRPKDEIGVHSLRLGGVVGEHTIRCAGQADELILGHRAFHRDLFAEGALTAARWLIGRQPGRYSMDDVLGLDP